MAFSEGDYPERLWHYTSGSAARSIFESATLWAGHLGYMSDTSEVNQAVEISLYVVQRLRAELPEHDGALQRWTQYLTDDPPTSWAPHVFAVSFSEVSDLLSQWRGYATGPGGPVSIGFPSELLRQRLHIGEDTDWSLRRCIYAREEQEDLIEARIRRGLDRAANTEVLRPGETREGRGYTHIFAAVMGVAPYCKHPDFAEEREWRLVYGPADPKHVAKVHFVARQHTLAPYIEFRLTDDTPLDCIRWIAGPGPQQDRAGEALGLVARLAGMTGYSAGRSHTPYMP